MALCLAACDSSPQPVGLVTDEVYCYLGGAGGTAGLLAADQVYGTTFNGRPAMWPLGYTGLRVGSEVEIHDPSGKLVATTGRRYYFSQAFAHGSESVKRMKDLGAIPVGDCHYAWSVIDCSAPSAIALPSCR